MRHRLIAVFIVALAAVAGWAAWRALNPPPRNVIIFVADGLRSGIVDDATAPDLAELRRQGVDFQNSMAWILTLPAAIALAGCIYFVLRQLI
jgi:hypothetical protein